MHERYRLPDEGRTPNFYADFTIQDEKGYLVATEGWMEAPNRGDELMSIVQSKLQQIATEKGKKVVHRFEAASQGGKKLIQKYSDYRWVGRSSDRNPLYEKEYFP
jgi:hypothetical protein